jgi:hypothetical protein
MRFFAQRFVVAPHERAFLYKDGHFVAILEPGNHQFVDAWRRYAVERFETTAAAFVHPLLDRLVEAAAMEVERCFERVETSTTEVALVYRGNRVADVVGPSERRFYWRAYGQTRVERLALDDALRADTRVAAAVGTGNAAIYVRVVPEGHEGLLFVDGVLAAAVPAGVHAFWRFGRTVEVELVDLRLQSIDIDGQRLLTRDRVSLTVNATVSYRLKAGTFRTRTVRNARDFLCTEARVQLRSAVGGRELEALLTEGAAVEDAATAAAAARLADFGIEVRRVGIREVLLSRELRRLCDGTYAAERQVLGLRVRELQAMERMARSVSSLVVNGPLETWVHGS